jgi:hypothetical protein
MRFKLSRLHDSCYQSCLCSALMLEFTLLFESETFYLAETFAYKSLTFGKTSILSI